MAENTDDKGYRRILSDRRNFCDFVKTHIAAPWAERLDADCLELVNTRFVTKDFKDKEADVIYKARVEGGDAVFYVHLELQSDPDFTMPFRLLVYMTELLRQIFAEAGEKARSRKGFRLPAVVPVVLYNGGGKWNCAKSFREYLGGCALFAPNVIDFEYILIDINEPDEAALLNTPTLMNLAMLADRSGTPERVLRRLHKVLEAASRLTQDERLQLHAWIFDVVLRKAKGKAGRAAIERIGEAFERKEGPEMTYALERAIDAIERRGERKGKREGERRGRLEAAAAMIGEGFPLETASRCSGIPADELMRHMEARKPQ
jgi:predicted transposase/invertase (TIGR01784 family)